MLWSQVCFLRNKMRLKTTHLLFINYDNLNVGGKIAHTPMKTKK